MVILQNQNPSFYVHHCLLFGGIELPPINKVNEYKDVNHLYFYSWIVVENSHS